MEENTNNEVKKAHISVLLPTRGRQEVLKDSITGLIEKASNPSEVEILFGTKEMAARNSALERRENFFSKTQSRNGENFFM